MNRLLIAFLAGCAGPASKPPATDTTHATSSTTEADTAPPDPIDTAPPDPVDTAPPDPIDTATPPCTAGLQARAADIDLASGQAVDLGEAPSRAGQRVLTLALTNPCEDDLRFLGHPDDWVSGESFGLGTLPPVVLEPGASADITVVFTPGAPGAATGTFRLPYDQQGSPYTLDLAATSGPPVAVVFAGEGRRVTTTADYGETWSTDTWDTLESHTNALQRAICYGAGTFVTVGGNDGAYWWTSPEGDAWTALSATGSPINACAFGDGRFFAVDGDLLTSTDGANWTRFSQPYATGHFRGMAYGSLASGTPVALAVGDGGRVAYTSDGETWAFDGTPVTSALQAVTWFSGTSGPVFVAVGAGGTIATSTDGERWVSQTVGSGLSFSAIAASADTLLVGNGSAVYGSPDGFAWSLVNASAVVPRINIGDLWFGTAGNAIFRSEDNGFSWTEVHAADSGPTFLGAATANEASP